MQYDYEYLIIGQGIAGTLLSYELWQHGHSFCIIDDGYTNNSSLKASAVINPLVAKKWHIGKDVAQNLPNCIATYTALEKLLNIQCLSSKPILLFSKDNKELECIRTQIALHNPYIRSVPPDEQPNSFSKTADAIITPCYIIDAHRLLHSWKTFISIQKKYLEERCLASNLSISDNTVQYKNIKAQKIIFCEGAPSGQQTLFDNHIFTPNRGDILLLSIPDLDRDKLYHMGVRLAPYRDNLFWCGSNYRWMYDNLQPDIKWREATLQTLKAWLNIPFNLIEHLVAERPTTAGQKNILEQHPKWQHVYRFNGLGTRGFSAGPGLAKEMYTLITK